MIKYKIDENTWRIEDVFVRSFLLIGEEKALLIDSGATEDNIDELVKEITELPVELITTHADPDHIRGNSKFDWTYMHAEDENLYRSFGNMGEIRYIKDGDEFDLGGRTVRVVEMPGHTAGCIGLLDVEKRVFFAGDSIQNHHIHMYEERRNLPKFKESLERLDTSAFDTIYPSHGNFPLGPDFAAKLAEDAGKVIAGEVEGKDDIKYGTPITVYSTETADFLCERK